MKSARKIIAFPKSPLRPNADETAFLPAALEVVETPASPAGRAVAAAIIGIFCFSLAWASLTHIDMLASEPGKTILSGCSKVRHPFETGIVRATHVRDGQRVFSGDVLVELDPRINEAERG